MKPQNLKLASSTFVSFDAGSADSVGEDCNSETSDKEQRLNNKIAEHFQLEDPQKATSIREAFDLIRLRQGKLTEDEYSRRKKQKSLNELSVVAANILKYIEGDQADSNQNQEKIQRYAQMQFQE